MIHIRIAGLIVLAMLLSNQALSQEILPLETAIEKALVNNYQIKIQKYDTEVAALQVNPAMVGRRPQANLQANYELGWSDASVETIGMGPAPEGNTIINLDGISNDIIISPEISMVLLDGKAGKYRLQQLNTASELSQLQLRQLLEQTVFNVSLLYLQMAEQQSQLDIIRQSIAFDQDRLQRARQDARYGTSSSLEELQIEVDLKTDSASYRNLILAYDNTRRNLNRLINQDLDTEFSVSSQLALNENLDYQELLSDLKNNSSILKLRDKNQDLADLNVKLAQSAYQPSLQGYANLSYAYLQNDASFLQVNRSYGPNIGLRLNVPLFDGGARRIKKESAIINQAKSRLERQDSEAELIKELNNAYAIYQNSLAQLQIEKSNLIAFERNLENMQNRYQTGTVTNTDVRGAQLNLNAAQNRINNYNYTIKQAEVQLLLLAGKLINP